MQRLATILFLSLIAVACSDAQGISVTPAFPGLSFNNPVGIYNAGDGTNRLFVVEQRGVIRVFENSPTVSTSRVFLDIVSRVTSGGELGLLGLAFDPDFASNGTFYLNYTAPDPRRTVIARYRVAPGGPQSGDTMSEEVILTVEQPYPNHNGGQIAFGPDGYLYIGMGDGGSGGDPQNNGQTMTSLLGKILRIDVHDTAEGKNYKIPEDNPYAASRSVRREIWAHGVRNPWRFSFDRSTGRLWAGDVGQGQWEEVDIIEKGRNYGWRIMEGFHCYPPNTTNCDTTGLAMPVWEYPHDTTGGASITGGFVYRGSAIPSLRGKYIYGDFGSGKIWALTYNGPGDATNELLRSSGLTISSFGVDRDSNLYICSFNGKIYKLTTPSDVEEVADAGFALHGSIPNPAKGRVVISYTLGRRSPVRLTLHDLAGREVASLVDDVIDAGGHEAPFEAALLPQGTYYCRLVGGGRVATARVTIER